MSTIQLARAVRVDSHQLSGTPQQHAPYRLTWECPLCEKAQVGDFSTDLSMHEPAVGQPFVYALKCCGCHEVSTIALRFDISLSVVPI